MCSWKTKHEKEKKRNLKCYKQIILTRQSRSKTNDNMNSENRPDKKKK